jgi:hypothetical protein
MKLQIPKSKLQGNFNEPSFKHQARRLFWMLTLEDSLGSGVWDLGFLI